ncbi:MAG TPA: hypothetical protein ACFYED_06245 [Candidatus Tripitaka californicus]|uniref:hypothetical protein n=1 Tax=Candidatus Tripitaka californicus TaxID=3367616 RepID=UPI0040277830|nr:hypothetical protein [Planctomycetota bacterium]
MLGSVKIVVFVLTGLFVIFFSLIFFTRVGQSKGYNFFIAELALFNGVLCATLADTNVAVLTLPFMLPFIGGLVYCVFASVLFGKAAFSQPNQKKYKGEPPYNPNA